MSMSFFNVRKFLKIIEATPAIWDWRTDAYTNKIMRDKGWMNIGQIMVGKSWETLDKETQEEKLEFFKNKWRHIRDCFMRDKRARIEGQQKQYIYADMLKFLEGVICMKKYEVRRKTILHRKAKHKKTDDINGPEEVQIDDPSTPNGMAINNDDSIPGNSKNELTEEDSELSMDFSAIQQNLDINFKTEANDLNENEENGNAYAENTETYLPDLDHSDLEERLQDENFQSESGTLSTMRKKRKPNSALDKAVLALKDIAEKYSQEENEFEVFGRHVAKQLSSMPLDEALRLQEEIQRMMTWTRLRCLRNLGVDP